MNIIQLKTVTTLFIYLLWVRKSRTHSTFNNNNNYYYYYHYY